MTVSRRLARCEDDFKNTAAKATTESASASVWHANCLRMRSAVRREQYTYHGTPASRQKFCRGNFAMNALHRTRPGIGSLVVLGFLVLGAVHAVANQNPSVALEEVAATELPTVAPQQPHETVPPSPEAVLNEDTADFEELLRGPLHEAYAEQYSPQPVESALPTASRPSA